MTFSDVSVQGQTSSQFVRLAYGFAFLRPKVEFQWNSEVLAKFVSQQKVQRE